MEILETAYGALSILEVLERHQDGSVMACLPKGESVLQTPFGLLTPQYTTDDLRKKTAHPVTFHPDGSLSSLPLERQATLETPVGELPAELVSFHPNGALRRVFPLNGRLSGYWTQDDEAGLAQPLTLSTPQGSWQARFMCVSFTPSGKLHSVTLWPGELLPVETPAGRIEARIGVSFHPDGRIRCLEPSAPTPVLTQVGEILAFDPDAVGISGDANSLAFAPDGRVVRVATVQSMVQVRPLDLGVQSETLAPGQRESLCGLSESEPVPLHLCFENGDLLSRLGGVGRFRRFALDECEIATEHIRPEMGSLELSPKLTCSM